MTSDQITLSDFQLFDIYWSSEVTQAGPKKVSHSLPPVCKDDIVEEKSSAFVFTWILLWQISCAADFASPQWTKAINGGWDLNS